MNSNLRARGIRISMSTQRDSVAGGYAGGAARIHSLLSLHSLRRVARTTLETECPTARKISGVDMGADHRTPAHDASGQTGGRSTFAPSSLKHACEQGAGPSTPAAASEDDPTPLRSLAGRSPSSRRWGAGRRSSAESRDQGGAADALGGREVVFGPSPVDAGAFSRRWCAAIDIDEGGRHEP